MKSLSGYYGPRSGTNRDMAASIVDHCRSIAEDGGDLEEEHEIVESIYRQCYPGCGEEGDDY